MRSITASSLRDFDRWQISSPWPAFAGIFSGSPRNMTKLLPAWRRARPINRHPWYGGNVYGLCGMAFGARRRLAPWPVRGAHSMPACWPGVGTDEWGGSNPQTTLANFMRFPRGLRESAAPHASDQITRREVTVIGKSLAVLIVIAGISASASLPSLAQDDETAAIAKALPEATVSIEQGLKLSEPQGKPISAEYEIDSGMLLLSVYTVKENQFREVTINAKSGSLEKVEPLRDGDAVKDAQNQSAAMEKAKVPLDVALGIAVNENNGYRAASIVPLLDGERPVASIILIKGEDAKRVVEKLE